MNERARAFFRRAQRAHNFNFLAAHHIALPVAEAFHARQAEDGRRRYVRHFDPLRPCGQLVRPRRRGHMRQFVQPAAGRNHSGDNDALCAQPVPCLNDGQLLRHGFAQRSVSVRLRAGRAHMARNALQHAPVLREGKARVRRSPVDPDFKPHCFSLVILRRSARPARFFRQTRRSYKTRRHRSIRG